MINYDLVPVALYETCFLFGDAIFGALIIGLGV